MCRWFILVQPVPERDLLTPRWCSCLGQLNKTATESLSRLTNAFNQFSGWIVLLALVYLAIFAYQVIAQPSGSLDTSLEWASYIINLIFVADFLIRFASADNRIRFIFVNFLELLSLILPFIRALRIFRLLVAANAIQKHVSSKQARASLNLAISMPLVIFVSALAILDVERNALGATITNFPIAIWWSVATMATVGDGSFSPVTWEGRVVAAALMIVGIGLFGGVAALFASNFINIKPEADSK
jgi:voltage-gated potassium channel